MTAHKGKVLLAAVCLVVGTSVANQSFTNAKNDWDFGNAQNWNNKRSIDYDGTETARSFMCRTTGWRRREPRCRTGRV